LLSLKLLHYLLFLLLSSYNPLEVKDKKYGALKAYIESGDIKSFTEIFDIVPKSQFTKDTGINWTRLTNKISNPDKFSVKDIRVISQLIGVDSRKLYDLIATAADKASRKKS
jgi:hypothetical protein